MIRHVLTQSTACTFAKLLMVLRLSVGLHHRINVAEAKFFPASILLTINKFSSKVYPFPFPRKKKERKRKNFALAFEYIGCGLYN